MKNYRQHLNESSMIKESVTKMSGETFDEVMKFLSRKHGNIFTDLVNNGARFKAKDIDLTIQGSFELIKNRYVIKTYKNRDLKNRQEYYGNVYIEKDEKVEYVLDDAERMNFSIRIKHGIISFIS